MPKGLTDKDLNFFDELAMVPISCRLSETRCKKRALCTLTSGNHRLFGPSWRRLAKLLVSPADALPSPIPNKKPRAGEARGGKKPAKAENLSLWLAGLDVVEAFLQVVHPSDELLFNFLALVAVDHT
jgi:hypothetical protein